MEIVGAGAMAAIRPMDVRASADVPQKLSKMIIWKETVSDWTLFQAGYLQRLVQDQRSAILILIILTI
jgi:hypothetical protein